LRGVGKREFECKRNTSHLNLILKLSKS